MGKVKLFCAILMAILVLNSFLPYVCAEQVAQSYVQNGVYVKGNEDVEQYLNLLAEDLPSESKQEVVRPTSENKAVNDTELMVVMKKEYSNPYYHMTLQHFPCINALELKEYMKADNSKNDELINFQEYRNILKFTFENNDDLEAAIEILSKRPDIRAISYNLEIQTEYDLTSSPSAIYFDNSNSTNTKSPINGKAFVNRGSEVTYVAEVSGLKYKEVGFVFEFYDKKVTKSTTTVYESIEDSSISIDKINNNHYLYAFTITDTDGVYNIYATPYAVELNGNVIYGDKINSYDTLHIFETADYSYRVYDIGYSKFEWMSQPIGYKINNSDELKNVIYNNIELFNIENHKKTYDEVFEHYNNEFFKSNSLFICLDTVETSTLYKNHECSITDDTMILNSTEEIYYPSPDAIISVIKLHAVKNNNNINSVEWCIDHKEFYEDKEYNKTISKAVNFKTQ